MWEEGNREEEPGLYIQKSTFREKENISSLFSILIIPNKTNISAYFL